MLIAMPEDERQMPLSLPSELPPSSGVILTRCPWGLPHSTSIGSRTGVSPPPRSVSPRSAVKAGDPIIIASASRDK